MNFGFLLTHCKNWGRNQNPEFKIQFGKLIVLWLLASGFWLLSTASSNPVYAVSAGDIPTCEGGQDETIDSILGSGDGFLTPLPPISDHFTRKVLERAQASIERAESFGQVFDPDTGYLNWLEKAFSTMARIIDAKHHLIQRARDLRENTACLHIDLFLLEAMMERVRCKLQFAFEQKRFNTILELEKLMVFLENHYEELILGARDNAYEDSRWFQHHSFDVPPTWCLRGGACEPLWFEECTGEAYGTMEDCMEEGGGNEWTMCPFHSDYLPPTVAGSGGIIIGYGCDLETLKKYERRSFNLSRLNTSIKAEYDALKELIELRDAFINSSSGLKEDTINLDTWMGREPPQGMEYWGRTKEDDREHYMRLGCSSVDGKEIHVPPKLPPDPDELDELKKDEEVDFSDYWPPKWPGGAAKWENRGPFSLEKADVRLLREYQNLREEWGRKRPIYYALSVELEPFELLSISVFSLFEMNPLDWFQELIARRPLKKWDIYQERITSASVTQGSDTQLEFYKTLRPIQEAVSEFTQYAGELDASSGKGGIRNFARGLTYFLRRSCLNRPCNERLECLLIMTLNDKCFPYTSGGVEAGNICACLKPLYDLGYDECYREIDPKKECNFKEPEEPMACETPES